MKSFLFFSHNKKKISEVKKIFKNSSLKIISLTDFEETKEPKENGRSFAENAKIKSLFGFKKFKMPCFADDSGIAISAMKNKPGIHSKRFLNNFITKEEAFNFIISSTIKKNDKKALFNTTICLTLGPNQQLFFVGKISGQIANKPKGLSGFGYDPIFIPDGFNKTFGELGYNKKNKFSHRVIALKKMESFLIN